MIVKSEATYTLQMWSTFNLSSEREREYTIEKYDSFKWAKKNELRYK